MKLGILINTDRHVADVIGLAKAAVSKGHEVTIFNTDDGVKLLSDPKFVELRKTKGVSISFCDHSTKVLNISIEGVPGEIVCSGQYNNAVMMHNADRVIVL